MTMQHTPGPWKLEPDWLGDDLRGHIPVSADREKGGQGGHLALAQVVWIMEDDAQMGLSSPICEANARLIAAAPELLAALITAKWMLERDYIDEQKLTTIRKCEAAITKATQPPPPQEELPCIS